MLIDSLMGDPGPEIYYNERFRNVLEDHMSYLRNDSETRVLNIDSFSLYKYEGDIFGMLNANGIPRELQWVVMRMNNLNLVSGTKDNLVALLIPSRDLVERIRQLHMTKIRDIY